MAIKEYIEADGRSKFLVSVVRKSKTVMGLRVQKTRSGLTSLAEAKRQEKFLNQEALTELVLKEQQGQSWQNLIDDFEMSLRHGRDLARPVTSSTAADYLEILRLYTATWNRKPACSISRIDVRQVLDAALASGKSKARAIKIKNVIHAVFTYGIDTGKIRGMIQSPAIGISLGRNEQRKPGILTLEEIKKLLHYARLMDHPWAPIWTVALHTGMRNGELYALQWTDVDFENRRITISKSWNKRTRSVKSTKSGDWREVTINAELEGLLKGLKLKAAVSPFVLPRFPFWDKGEQARILRKFCMEIGISPVKFHDLRACFATQLLRAGVAPAVVMKVAGWKDIKTMQRYVRLAGIEIEGATDRLQFLDMEQTGGKVLELYGSGKS